jgi:PemK-like, MazF-like toxin of type II toxin-antitoxin system
VPGMVLSYSYLWHRQSEKGETEGRKDRPATVVLVTSRTGFGEIVYVLPISTSEPKPDDPWKMEIPPSIKERLGLDDRRSWIDVTEFNVSAWTPFHLRPTKKATGKDNSAQETCLYGYLPSGFFRKVVDAADEYRRTRKPRLVAR